MIYHNLAKFIVASFFFICLFLTIRRKRVALLLMFILGLGISGFNTYWGTLWFPYKISALFILAISLYEYRIDANYRYFNIFVFLFLASLLLAMFLTPPNEFYEFADVPTFQQRFVRPFIQFVSYLSIASIIPFTIKTLRNELSLNKFFFGYFLIVEIIMLFGILQFILQKFGIDFMPILRPNVIDSPTAAFNLEGVIITRIYGITGEPKALASFLFPYLFVSIFNINYHCYKRNRVYNIVMLLLCFFTIINTFSSAALISLFIALALSAFIWFRNRFKTMFIIAFSILSLWFINIDKFTITSFEPGDSISLFDLIKARTITRLSNEFENTFEYRAISYLLETSPYLSITGFGLGMYPYYLTGGGSHGINPIDSGWIVILVDFGVMGIGVFLYVFFKIFSLRRKEAFKRDMTFNSALIGLLAAYILGLGIGSYIYMILFLSLSLAACRIKIQNQNISLRRRGNFTKSKSRIAF